MINDITTILNKLNLEDTGRYDNHYYIINLQNSNDYAKMYTKLCTTAVNTEFPNFGKNTNDTTIKATNYFELEENGIKYNLFLIANFDSDTYYLKIKEN